MKEVLGKFVPLLGASLDDGNEVVQVDIYVCCVSRELLRRELFLAGVSLGLRRTCVVRHSGIVCLLQRMCT